MLTGVSTVASIEQVRYSGIHGSNSRNLRRMPHICWEDSTQGAGMIRTFGSPVKIDGSVFSSWKKWRVSAKDTINDTAKIHRQNIMMP